MDSFNKKMITISEAAQYLGVSEMTLRRWHQNGSFEPTFVSPGKHRYYSYADLGKKTKGLFRLAQEWVETKEPSILPDDFYCATSDVFKARHERMTKDMYDHPILSDRAALVSSASGEIGNNSFDHNLGNWPDMMGVFFAYDFGKRIIVLADRGVGVLHTLRKVKLNLQSDADALHTAFTEIITGRAPEHRGNGLKFAREAIHKIQAAFYFQSGDAVFEINKGASRFTITKAVTSIRGSLSLMTFK